ncbi:ABC transporter permease [Paenibacillus thalictri]|uniref:Sugar ABC transporter permease n=1 Tax=Paenibacillus thalictri TaxID=2527873 RepID=A0A4Q9DNZ8_9BACL|nr:ABC transporter permease subunit [Paenibacillus thalictri]TBL75332.1 sugar ABC transporter permease [Paenibacillus thalictri]
MEATAAISAKRKSSTWLRGKAKRNIVLYIFLAPAALYYILFHYAPMYGTLIAFQDYNPFRGMLESPWVGLKHFQKFFESIYFYRLIRNTFLIGLYSIVFGFTVPIVFALLLHEVKHRKFRSLVQSISYLPHFISTVVVAGLIVMFTSPSTGLINGIITFFGGAKIDFLREPGWFRTVYISSGVWQTVGWSSIIYFAALTSISPSLYEAADMDGANRWQKVWHISLPGIKPTVITILLLDLGRVMDVGFEKVFLLYNSATYETADVLSTYVYRSGLIDQQYSFAAAVGLFNSAITFALIIGFNQLARRLSGYSLW